MRTVPHKRGNCQEHSTDDCRVLPSTHRRKTSCHNRCQSVPSIRCADPDRCEAPPCTVLRFRKPDRAVPPGGRWRKKQRDPVGEFEALRFLTSDKPTTHPEGRWHHTDSRRRQTGNAENHTLPLITPSAYTAVSVIFRTMALGMTYTAPPLSMFSVHPGRSISCGIFTIAQNRANKKSKRC